MFDNPDWPIDPMTGNINDVITSILSHPEERRDTYTYGYLCGVVDARIAASVIAGQPVHVPDAQLAALHNAITARMDSDIAARLHSTASQHVTVCHA